MISVSEDMAIVAVYVRDQKHTARADPAAAQPGQPGDPDPRALQATASTRSRLRCPRVEVEDLVTVRDVVTVLQRTEMVRRIAEEIELDIIELGVDGRLVRLQLEELMGGVEDDRRLVIQDYFHEDVRLARRRGPRGAGRPRAPRTCSTSRPSAPRSTCPTSSSTSRRACSPRGFRLLHKIPRLPEPIIERIVERFGSLQKIMRATIDDLDDVDGVGETRARAIKEGLSPPGRVQHPRPLLLTAPRAC